MKERTKERTRIIYKLRIFDRKQNRLIGTLVDITPAGIMIIGRNELEENIELSLRMDMPRNVTEGGQIDFAARCQWCRKNEPGNYFAMGFQFLGLHAKDKATISDLIVNFCQENGEGDYACEMNPELP